MTHKDNQAYLNCFFIAAQPSMKMKKIHYSLTTFVAGFQALALFSAIIISLSTFGPVAANVHQDEDCTPGQEWKWEHGPDQSELAHSAQQALRDLGIEASVDATSIGEVDACDRFYPQTINFRVIVSEKPSSTDAGIIYDVLQTYGQTQLGQITLIDTAEQTSYRLLQTGETVPLSEPIADTQIPSNFIASWQKISTQNSPSGRYTHGMAYDTQRKIAVLFGGDSNGNTRLQDTWEFDGINWIETTPTISPSGRVNIDQALVYDKSRGKVVLFGGLSSQSYQNDTWEYDGVTWAQITTPSAPPARDSQAMSYDTARNVTILFGGYGNLSLLQDTWEYDGQWHLIMTSQSPSKRYHHAMAYDEKRQRLVLFGGSDIQHPPLGDTWEYDGSTWTQITLTNAPIGRENHSMVYDSERGVVVLFGGENAQGLLNDLWEYDGIQWKQINAGQVPSTRKEMPLVYDPQKHVVAFFGRGYCDGAGLHTFNETWQYSQMAQYQSFLPSVTKDFSPADVMQRNVYVIVYDPVLSSGQLLSDYLHWNEHATLTQGTIDFFAKASKGRIQYNITYTTILTDGWPTLTDGFRYTESEYLSVLQKQSAPHSPDGVDYNRIVNSPQLDICGKANRGEIDEVWIYNGPYFGFYESTLVGPGAYFYNSPPVPGPFTCQRLIPIMGPSPEVGQDNAIHNFGHRTESTLRYIYGSWLQNRTAHSWEKFALVKALSPNYSYSGCGNIHYPPNGTSDYNYTNTATTPSNCNDFAHYPNLGDPNTTSLPVTCSTWECSHLKYLDYWFSHMPSNRGCGPDGIANNWWLYFADPALALHPSYPCQTK